MGGSACGATWRTAPWRRRSRPWRALAGNESVARQESRALASCGPQGSEIVDCWLGSSDRAHRRRLMNWKELDCSSSVDWRIADPIDDQQWRRDADLGF